MGHVLARQGNVPDFEVPDGLSFVFIDPETGLLAGQDCPNKFLEVFKTGTEPQKYSHIRKRVKIKENDFYLNFVD